MPDKIKIDDLAVEVVSDEEAEAVDFVVCMPATTPSRFEDNLTGFCCQCGIKVIYRWHAPRKPPKICMECMIARAKGTPPKEATP